MNEQTRVESVAPDGTATPVAPLAKNEVAVRPVQVIMDKRGLGVFIGSALLEFGATYGPHFNEVGKPALQIVDVAKFTRAIGQTLTAELAEGGTFITAAIDAAVLEVCTNGQPDACGFIRGEVITDEAASNRKPIEPANDASAA